MHRATRRFLANICLDIDNLIVMAITFLRTDKTDIAFHRLLILGKRYRLIVCLDAHISIENHQTQPIIYFVKHFVIVCHTHSSRHHYRHVVWGRLFVRRRQISRISFCSCGPQRLAGSYNLRYRCQDRHRIETPVSRSPLLLTPSLTHPAISRVSIVLSIISGVM